MGEDSSSVYLTTAQRAQPASIPYDVCRGRGSAYGLDQSAGGIEKVFPEYQNVGS